MITRTALAQTLRKLRLLAPLVLVAIDGAAAAPEFGQSGVRHPNLLLNQAEIEQVKVKIREHA